MRAPIFFAQRQHPDTGRSGPVQGTIFQTLRCDASCCFFCGNPCDDSYLTEEYVRDTFTDHDIVACPASPYVCRGCVVAISMGYPLFHMIDGEERVPRTPRAGQPRLYSWVLTHERQVAATKAHVHLLRQTVLSPPDPPFAIVLADSGQKQIIFRCPVAHDRMVYPLQMEEETIIVDVDRLEALLHVADMLSAACGKVVLRDEPDQRMAMAVYARYGSVDLVEQWREAYATPMGRLAAWLAKSKKEAVEAQKEEDRST